VELEGEIRLTVDELMREELKNLKMVMEASYIIATHLLGVVAAEILTC
jgi:hypothetical protein